MRDTAGLVLDEVAIARQVENERIHVFNERSVTAARLAFVGMALMFWVLVKVVGWERAFMWGACMVAVEGGILLAGVGCERALQRQSGQQFWLRVQMALAAASGAAWGTAVWFVWIPGEFVPYLATLTILIGVAGVSIVTMSSYASVAVYFFGLIYLFPLLHEIVHPKGPSEFLVAGLLVIMPLQIWFARGLGLMLLREVEQYVRNQAMVVRLDELVTHDQLTGAYSRRFMLEQLEQQVAIHGRHGTPVSLIMFDLDHFKAINDGYGHATGDRALREAVRCVAAQLREGDLLGRVGGEEFLVLLPLTTLPDAHALAERLRQTLASTRIAAGETEIPIPASFGVAQLGASENYSDWLRRVDGAMYQAKAHGRNATAVAP